VSLNGIPASQREPIRGSHVQRHPSEIGMAAALTVALAAVSHPDMKPAVAVLLKASLVAASQSL